MSTFPSTHLQKTRHPYQVTFHNADSSTEVEYLKTKTDAIEHAARNHNGRRVSFYQYTKSKPWGYFDEVSNVKQSAEQLANDYDAEADGFDVKNNGQQYARPLRKLAKTILDFAATLS